MRPKHVSDCTQIQVLSTRWQQNLYAPCLRICADVVQDLDGLANRRDLLRADLGALRPLRLLRRALRREVREEGLRGARLSIASLLSLLDDRWLTELTSFTELLHS